MDDRRDAFLVPPEVSYFNTASLAPQLHRVRDAGVDALRRRGEPWAIQGVDWHNEVERLREAFGSLIGAPTEAIARVPATSYGFAVAARNLRLNASDRILVLAEEYPSGIYTWRRAARTAGAEMITVSRRQGHGWTAAILDALDERVTVVSVPNVHWTDGALVDLAAVARRTHDIGARLVIDGSQSIGAMPFDVAELDPDFLVTVGYKWLLGPFGVGYLYVAERHWDGEPLEENWIVRAGSEDLSRLVDYRDDYQPGARRFDVGGRTNFELTPMALAALGELEDWGLEDVTAALGEITAKLAARVSDIGLEPTPPAGRGPHILGLPLPTDSRTRIPQALDEAGCYVGLRGNSLRISPHLHITDEDVDRLVDALHRAVAG
jgi:selenocysteine lyase/cysteine desulfurase